tara:strand:+ start:5 stop:925 length:921 start_codon:yes stop_codon:yes gene_type:complete
MVTKSIERAQKKVEARNFSIRKHLLEYDDVMNSQRELVYERRNYALHNDDVSDLFNGIITEYSSELIDEYLNGVDSLKGADWDGLSADILDTFGIDISAQQSNILTSDQLLEYISSESKIIIDYKKSALPSGVFDNFQKVVIFTTIDQKWRQHLYSMDQLRGGIQLRAYGQKNPLIEYKKEGFGMFTEMMHDTNKETIKKVFRTNLVKTSESSISSSASSLSNIKKTKEDAPDLGFVAPPGANQSNPSGAQKYAAPPSQQRQPIVNEKKIGRNDRVTIRKGSETKIIKWKKAQQLIQSEGWSLDES